MTFYKVSFFSLFLLQCSTKQLLAMESLQCPLGRQAFLTPEQPMGLQQLTEIEEHVAANNLDCPHPPLKDLVFDGNFINGSTPLLMACYFGELASVKRIVEGWGVDANQSAVYYFNPYKSPYQYDSRFGKALATPLFVAASRGHLDVVRYLVDQAGADVSAKTVNEANADYNGLSPLYGAVLENSSLHPHAAEDPGDRSPIVRLLLESGADPSTDTIRPSDGNPMWTSEYCGNDAITALVEHGMNVNHCYPNLHEISLLNHCILKKSLAVVKLLVDRGADLHTQNSLGLTPIILAAFLHYLDVVDFLLERNEISRIEKIEALELAGATILFDTRLTHFFPRGLEYWRRSLHLRRMDADGCGPITKSLSENLKKAGRIVGDWNEWTTLAQLEYIIQHRYEQEIQSFLIKSRILSTKKWGAVDYFFSDFKSWSQKLREEHRFIELLNLCWSMLETIQNFDPREEYLWITTVEVVQCLINTLGPIKRDEYDPLVNENTMRTSLKLILATDQYHLDDREYIDGDQLYNYMQSMFCLIQDFAQHPHLVNKESMECLTELVQRDKRRCPQNQGGLFLHLACGSQFLSSCDLHFIIATVRLLLRAGADPNAGDVFGNGALHLLAIASKEYGINDSILEPIARMLLNAGAHLDRVNNERQTAADLWLEPAYELKLSWGEEDAKYHPDAPLKSNMPGWLRDDSVPKLKCQCATVIRINGVPYNHIWPPMLHAFVGWH